jgi:hypothetical protein
MDLSVRAHFDTQDDLFLLFVCISGQAVMDRDLAHIGAWKHQLQLLREPCLEIRSHALFGPSQPADS